ncbi:hypothetical protein AMK59_7042 [Oryctes borbonicus]|uniref:Protein CNPPD1 n=1 Tax=Oryctes borbonicus TaxID=1629725 RepID=A0A0T6AVB2_9SCAR|nr:hypothetical protein AMK59_7042 [Oryctes borbonicus]
MSNISKKAKEKHLKPFGDHHNFLSRITKTLYYGKLPKSDRLSLPVTELATELFSEAKIGSSLERLHCNDAASISRNACISPCSFILAMLYLERLKTCNSDYLQRVNPSELFLVSLMVSSKFLYDDGEEDEVFMKEWAKSGGMTVKNLVQLEKDFLNAINWEIFVSEANFWKKLCDLEHQLAKKQGMNRGWFTYTELNSILAVVDAYHFYHYIVYLITILLATYTAGVVTIISSMFIVSQVPGNCLQSPAVKIDPADTPLFIASDNQCQTNLKEAVQNIENLTDFNCDILEETCSSRKQIDAADVLTTSLILASIQPVPDKIPARNNSYFDNPENDDRNNEKISWDWWTSPAMNWLASTSELVYFNLNFKDYVYSSYSDSTIVATKLIEQEDHFHKATRTRIQDQLERSWHKEWTDTIKKSIMSYKKPFEFFKSIKT